VARRVSAAMAKAHLSELMAGVAHQGKRYVIERRGKPVAALVSVGELEKLELESAASDRPLGALALAGAWREVEEDEFERILDDIYRERERDTGRQVDLNG
jgi:prevent-host-death family protein